MQSKCHWRSVCSLTNMKRANDFEGVWWLLSREDRARDGTLRIDPTLGPDALGLLTYANGRFAAQFMKRDRQTAVVAAGPNVGSNNTTAVGGYDAYFGTYVIERTSGEVIHSLDGALNPNNIGIKVRRRLTVTGDRLQIELETTTLEGEPVSRTLLWERVA
jgi:hypothetical protein